MTTEADATEDFLVSMTFFAPFVASLLLVAVVAVGFRWLRYLGRHYS